VTTITGCELQLEIILDPLELLAQIECENVCIGEVTNFTNLTDLVDGFELEYFWDFGDGTTSTEFQPSHQYLSPGTYAVTFNVEVVDEICLDAASCTVTVSDFPQINSPISHD
jgi:hypothetical protein